MENLRYTARRSTTAAIRMRSWPARGARRIAWYVACRSAPRSSRRWNNLDRSAKEVMPAFRGVKVAAAAE